jgi:DNA replication protein DnaC
MRAELLANCWYPSAGSDSTPPPASDKWHRRGVPPIYDEAVAADVPAPPYARALSVIAAGPPCNVGFFGPNGVGKSYAAAILAHLWDAQWINVPKLLARVRRTFSKWSEESELGVLDSLNAHKVLVLDDLMAFNRSEHGLSTIMSIVNDRLEQDLSTVVTCDKSLEHIDNIDSGLASRLGGYERISLTGKDRRLKRGVS